MESTISIVLDTLETDLRDITAVTNFIDVLPEVTIILKTTKDTLLPHLHKTLIAVATEEPDTYLTMLNLECSKIIRDLLNEELGDQGGAEEIYRKYEEKKEEISDKIINIIKSRLSLLLGTITSLLLLEREAREIEDIGVSICLYTQKEDTAKKLEELLATRNYKLAEYREGDVTVYRLCRDLTGNMKKKITDLVKRIKTIVLLCTPLKI